MNIYELQTEIKKLRAFLPGLIGGLVGSMVTLVLAASVLLAGPADFGDVRALFGGLGASSVNGSVSGSIADSGDVIVDVVEKVNPAVISIVITKDVPIIERYYESYGGPFGNFFNVPRYRQNGTEQQEVGGGSGFLISEDGYIVTNNHVVSDTEAEYTVFLNDGTEYAATVLATDAALDIALLKIDATGLSYLEFGDSDAVKVGQTVIAIGNALAEFRNTVSVGVISGLSRTITAGSSDGESEQLQDVLQTDAAINSGNSGGPLLNLDGYVIGVNVAASLGSENIAFALPANAVKVAVASMQKYGHVVRPYLGVRFTMINADLAARNNLDVDYGALVLRGEDGALAVIPGSPADKAGLVENDIILKINGEDITVDHPLNVALRAFAPDDTVTLHVLHDGEARDVEVTLGSTPAKK